MQDWNSTEWAEARMQEGYTPEELEQLRQANDALVAKAMELLGNQQELLLLDAKAVRAGRQYVILPWEGRPAWAQEFYPPLEGNERPVALACLKGPYAQSDKRALGLWREFLQSGDAWPYVRSRRWSKITYANDYFPDVPYETVTVLIDGFRNLP